MVNLWHGVLLLYRHLLSLYDPSSIIVALEFARYTGKCIKSVELTHVQGTNYPWIEGRKKE